MAKTVLPVSALVGLQKVDLFKGLDSYSLREIATQCKWIRCKRDQVVIRRDGHRSRRLFRDRRRGARGRGGGARPAHHLPRHPGGRGIRRAFGDRRARALRRRGRGARIAARLDLAGSVPRDPRQPCLGARAPAAAPHRIGARARRPAARARRAASAAPPLGRAAASRPRRRDRRQPRPPRPRAYDERHREPRGHLARAGVARAFQPDPAGDPGARRPHPGACRRGCPRAAGRRSRRRPRFPAGDAGRRAARLRRRPDTAAAACDPRRARFPIRSP